MKLTKKHFQIFDTIAEKGYYKPTYSDQEPATQKLIKEGIIDWRDDFKGVILTPYGKKFVSELN